MDPEVVQKGRSYGGVGFICKEQIGVSYRTIDVNSDRVCCIQTLSNICDINCYWCIYAL